MIIYKVSDQLQKYASETRGKEWLNWVFPTEKSPLSRCNYQKEEKCGVVWCEMFLSINIKLLFHSSRIVGFSRVW